MKPVAYCTMISLILAILLIHALVFYELMNSSNSDSTEILLIIMFSMSVGACIGLIFQKKKRLPNMRPLVYWPLIGVLCGLVMKAGGLTEVLVWLCITFIIGILFERKRG